MANLNRLLFSPTSEKHNSGHLNNVCLLHVRVLEHVNEQIFETFVRVRNFKLVALENHNGFQVAIDYLRCLEVINSSKIFNTCFEEVENVSVVNAPKSQIVRTLLLVRANAKETCVVLHSLIFDQTWVFKWSNVMSSTHQKLDHVLRLHNLNVFQQVVNCLG